MATKSIKMQNAAVSLSNTRVGNVRYYTKDGKTYTRTVASAVSNPRTDKQMRLRTRIGNAVNSWRYLKTFLEKCFEDASRSVSGYNKFVQLAMKSLQVYLTKTQAKTGACVAAPYAVSMGSLPKVDYALNTNGILQSNIKVGNDFQITATTTVGELADAIVNNQKGIWAYDDYITFFEVLQRGDSEYPYIDPNGWNLKLVKGSSDKVLDKVSAKGFSVAGRCIAMADEPEAGCYAWIHSREGDNGKQVSGQYLYNCNETFLAGFISEDAFDEAKVTYGNSSNAAFIYSDSSDAEPSPTPPTPSTGKTITVNVADYCSAMGKVQINDGPMDNTEKSLEVEPGTQVTIKAAPVSGYQFCNWSDGDSNATRTVTVNDDCEFTAEFEES